MRRETQTLCVTSAFTPCRGPSESEGWHKKKPPAWNKQQKKDTKQQTTKYHAQTGPFIRPKSSIQEHNKPLYGPPTERQRRDGSCLSLILFSHHQKDGNAAQCGRRKATWSDSVNVLFCLNTTTEFIIELSKRNVEEKRRRLACYNKPGLIEMGSGYFTVSNW